VLQTDDRQTTDGRAIAYSERECEFVSLNVNVSSRSLKTTLDLAIMNNISAVAVLSDTNTKSGIKLL